MKCLVNILLQLICDAESQTKPTRVTPWQNTTTEPANWIFTDQNNILYLVGEKRCFNATEQYSWKVQGSYKTAGAWQFTFTGFSMSHCFLANTEQQQEIDSKNKKGTISISCHPIHLPLVLNKSIWGWERRDFVSVRSGCIPNTVT